MKCIRCGRIFVAQSHRDRACPRCVRDHPYRVVSEPIVPIISILDSHVEDNNPSGYDGGYDTGHISSPDSASDSGGSCDCGCPSCD